MRSRRQRNHRVGLGYWMRRVLRECHRAGGDFAPDPVHDLRVALRRCRSMADGLAQLDPRGDWSSMRKAGRRLFRRLGRLRDIHVMLQWVRKLAPANDSVRKRLIPLLTAEERQLKERAREALLEFDRHRWRRWAVELPRRAGRVPAGHPAFQHLALERWQEARALHHKALRDRSQVAYHQLRIGLKRFRYTVENFLSAHAAWLRDLKRLQDALGEVHDLDVLRGRFFTRRTLFSEAEKRRWRRRVERERAKRLAIYRGKMLGRASLWHVWRESLPSGSKLESAALAKLAAWAGYLDPRFQHSRQVAGTALLLLDAMAAVTRNGIPRDARARRVLEAAALLHDVGRAEGSKGHHKATQRMIRELAPPIGWTAAEMQRVALVARFHRGAEPRGNAGALRALAPGARRRVVWLAGVLRLADGIVKGSRPSLGQLRVEVKPEAVFIRVPGYAGDRRAAALLGDRKHLMESLLRKPVVVGPEASGHRSRNRAA